MLSLKAASVYQVGNTPAHHVVLSYTTYHTMYLAFFAGGVAAFKVADTAEARRIATSPH